MGRGKKVREGTKGRARQSVMWLREVKRKKNESEDMRRGRKK